MEHELLSCQCESPEHIAIINKDNDGFVSLSVFLCRLPFFERLKHGLKYILGYKCRYGDFDEILLRKDDADKLQDVVNVLKGEK